MEDTIKNFHLINEQENKLNDFFRFYCQHASKSMDLTVQTCLNAFNQALYSTLRTVINTSGSTINAETQFAWRCLTNDLSTPDILGVYEIKRPSKRFLIEDLVLCMDSLGAPIVSRQPTRIDGRSSSGASKRSGGSKDSKQTSLHHSSSIADVQGHLNILNKY